jgi:capsular exopolysaccharide synthesis family protein
LSRIDEALKRAGIAPQARVGNDKAFVSPWTPPAGAFSSEEPESPSSQAEAEPALIAEDDPIAEIALDEAPLRHERPAALPPAPESLGTFATGNRGLVSFSSKWRERLATSPDADAVLVEQFRRIAATLHSSQAATGIRVLMVTSASPEDGKTLSALNLALVLSESYGRRVLLIDADLRRPSLGRAAELTEVPGLSDALKSKIEQKLTVLPVTPMLTLLPAGRPNPDPMGVLTSPRMRTILEEAAARFDWVILDAPPMGPMADANLLAEMSDAAVFVIRAGKTKYASVKKAIDTLGRERLLGVILNGLERMPKESYAYGYGDEERA